MPQKRRNLATTAAIAVLFFYLDYPAPHGAPHLSGDAILRIIHQNLGKLENFCFYSVYGYHGFTTKNILHPIK